jgi:mannose-1-phosphate guanylyltransferase
MELKPPSNVWSIVLAAGEGSRMAQLTRAMYGYELPKQFAALDGDRTLLQRTMDRTASVAPGDRTVVVVSDTHEATARLQLRGYPGVEIVSQPRNLGTGPGILLPLCHVLARDPTARVAVFPSDHHVRRPQVFVEAVARGFDAAAIDPECGVALVGAVAERPAVDLGWISRGERLRCKDGFVAYRVQRFVEKPPESVAVGLLASGSLWNTMVLGGHGQALWSLLERHLPEQVRGFAAYRARLPEKGAREYLARLYRDMAPADFSREVLERARGLVVVPVIDSGWFDCGTPERLIDWLKRTPELAGVLARVQNAGMRQRPAATHAAA